MADWDEVRSRCGLLVKGQAPSDHQAEMMGLICTEARGREPGANEETVAGAVATAIQESEVQNLEGGDKDSIGLYQQRPSQGWGTPEQLHEPVYAINAFLDQYLPYRAEGYGWLEASDKTQRSAHPDAPAQWYEEGVLAARCWPGDNGDGAPAPADTEGVPPLHVDYFGQGHNDTHGDVRTWQQKMSERGWSLDVDGAYGPESEETCREFQTEKGLSINGNVGPDTWEATWRTPVT
jgi:peptidoglycan hydrolase-like protein with peptidoglycan-binding domain